MVKHTPHPGPEAAQDGEKFHQEPGPSHESQPTLALAALRKARPKRQDPHPSAQAKTPRPRTACRGSRGVATKIPPRDSPQGMGELVGLAKKRPRFPPIPAAIRTDALHHVGVEAQMKSRAASWPPRVKHP